MKRNSMSHTDREGMIATSFLFIYILMSYVFVYWTKTMSNATVSRENLAVNIVMYLLPCAFILVMCVYREARVESLGMNSKGLAILLILLILSLTFYTSNLLLKILMVVICEEIVFRGYASERLKAAYGSIGSIIVAGFILGISYSLIPMVNWNITIADFLLYIGLGITTQAILQRMNNYFGNIYLSILIHASILLLVL